MEWWQVVIPPTGSAVAALAAAVTLAALAAALLLAPYASPAKLLVSRERVVLETVLGSWSVSRGEVLRVCLAEVRGGGLLGRSVGVVEVPGFGRGPGLLEPSVGPTLVFLGERGVLLVVSVPRGSGVVEELASLGWPLAQCSLRS